MNAGVASAVVKPRLSAALHYAAMGWPVFPVHTIIDGKCTCGGQANCKPGKHPRSRHGFKDANRTVSLIHQCDWERSNIGIATGKTAAIFVVDIDPQKFGDATLANLSAQYGDLPSTLTASTGGGAGGRHYFYKQLAGVKVPSVADKWGDGLDIRGDNGYVIVQPSVTKTGYQWLDCDMPTIADIAHPPEWLLKMVTTTAHVANDAPTPPPVRTAMNQEEIDAIKDALSHIKDADNRDRWLRVGMALHSTGMGDMAFDMWIAWSQQSKRYKASGQQAAWKSFKFRSDGIGIGTIYKLAEEQGWRRPLSPGIDITAILKQVQRPPEPSSDDAPPKSSIITVEEARPDDAGVTADRIPGVLGQIEDYFNQTSIVHQPEFAAATSIALGSVALGRLYVARAARDSYSSLFLCAIVRTGGGKEHIRSVLETSLQEAGLHRLIGGSGYTSGSAVFSTLADQPNHLTFIDELGRHLMSLRKGADAHQVQAITELMSVFGMLGGIYRPRQYALTGVPDKDKANFRKTIYAPAITLVGASTPSTFYDAVGTAGIVDGFLNRLLFFVGNDAERGSAFKPRSEPIPIPPDVVAWLKRVRTLKGSNLWGLEPHDVKPDPKVLLFSEKALQVMRDLEADVDKHRLLARKQGLEEVWVRTSEKAIRLALIAAVSDDSSVIGPAHAEWAAKRSMQSDMQLERACEGNIASSDYGKLCNSIWRSIAKAPNGALAEGKLSGACSPYREAPSRMRHDALMTLMTDNRIRVEKRTAKNGQDYDYLTVVQPNRD